MKFSDRTESFTLVERVVREVWPRCLRAMRGHFSPAWIAVRAHRAQATWADLARDARKAPVSLGVLSTDHESLSNRQLALLSVASGAQQPCAHYAVSGRPRRGTIEGSALPGDRARVVAREAPASQQRNMGDALLSLQGPTGNPMLAPRIAP